MTGYDYNGETFTFLIRGRKASSYEQKFVYADESNGEVFNDAVYARNLAVEEKLNINIEIVENNDGGEINDARQYILSGDPGVDVLSSHCFRLAELAAEGTLVDFNVLPAADLSAPYWNQNAVEQLTIANKLYLMANDISADSLDGARFLY